MKFWYLNNVYDEETVNKIGLLGIKRFLPESYVEFNLKEKECLFYDLNDDLICKFDATESGWSRSFPI